MTVIRWAPDPDRCEGAERLEEAAPADPPASLLDQLLEELEAFPAQPTAASRVLAAVDDPRSSATDLAGTVSTDPALTARTMRMANSAFYGLSGKVSSASFAVTVLGFATVRALAVATAAGILDDDDPLPPGFWDHAAATAVGASLVAPRVEVNHHEAFSVGLLHDLGDALLHRAAPEGWERARQQVGEAHDIGLVRAERDELGTDHAEAAARVLESWRFPALFVEAIENHHRPVDRTTSGLRRALVAGEVLAHIAAGHDRVDERRAIEAGVGALEAAGVDPAGAPGLAAQVRAESADLALTLTLL